MTPGVEYPWKGSAGIRVSASTPVTSAPAATSTSSAMSPRNGANQAAYQGRRNGIDNASSSSATPQLSTDAAGSSPAGRRASCHSKTMNSSRKATRTTPAASAPAPGPPNEATTARAARPTSRDGPAHRPTPPRVPKGANTGQPAPDRHADASPSPQTTAR